MSSKSKSLGKQGFVSESFSVSSSSCRRGCLFCGIVAGMAAAGSGVGAIHHIVSFVTVPASRRITADETKGISVWGAPIVVFGSTVVGTVRHGCG